MESKGKVVAKVVGVNFDDRERVDPQQARVTLQMSRQDAAELLKTGANALFTFQFEPWRGEKDKAA